RSGLAPQPCRLRIQGRRRRSTVLSRSSTTRGVSSTQSWLRIPPRKKAADLLGGGRCLPPARGAGCWVSRRRSPSLQYLVEPGGEQTSTGFSFQESVALSRPLRCVRISAARGGRGGGAARR